jgi:hypothetical protein
MPQRTQKAWLICRGSWCCSPIGQSNPQAVDEIAFADDGIAQSDPTFVHGLIIESRRIADKQLFRGLVCRGKRPFHKLRGLFVDVHCFARRTAYQKTSNLQAPDPARMCRRTAALFELCADSAGWARSALTEVNLG